MGKLNKKEADKRYFDRYKTSGRREENAKKRQEKIQKKIAKMKERTARKKAESGDPSNKEKKQIIEQTKEERFDAYFQEASEMKNDYLSPYKRAKKMYRINRILKENMPKDERNYSWWESLFDRLSNELKAEENSRKNTLRTLKGNKGKVTIESRREEKVYE